MARNQFAASFRLAGENESYLTTRFRLVTMRGIRVPFLGVVEGTDAVVIAKGYSSRKLS